MLDGSSRENYTPNHLWGMRGSPTSLLFLLHADKWVYFYKRFLTVVSRERILRLPSGNQHIFADLRTENICVHNFWTNMLNTLNLSLWWHSVNVTSRHTSYSWAVQSFKQISFLQWKYTDFRSMYQSYCLVYGSAMTRLIVKCLDSVLTIFPICCLFRLDVVAY